MMTRSPTWAQRAADPINEGLPVPRRPLIAYVAKRAPLSTFQMSMRSFSNMFAPTRTSSTIAQDPFVMEFAMR
jgi:hypothetical protein